MKVSVGELISQGCECVFMKDSVIWKNVDKCN